MTSPPQGKTDRTWTIREIADEFGVTTRTLRHYEEIGLVSPERQGTTRIFHRRDRTRLALVLRGKRLGFPLDEIATIVNLYDAPRGKRSQLVYVLEQIDDRRTDLEQRRRDLGRVRRNAVVRPGRERPVHGIHGEVRELQQDRGIPGRGVPQRADERAGAIPEGCGVHERQTDPLRPANRAQRLLLRRRDDGLAPPSGQRAPQRFPPPRAPADQQRPARRIVPFLGFHDGAHCTTSAPRRNPLPPPFSKML